MNEQDALSGNDQQGGSSIAVLEMDDESNADEENSDSNDDRFVEFLATKTKSHDNDGVDECNIPESYSDEKDDDIVPKMKKWKRIKISSDEDD